MQLLLVLDLLRQIGILFQFLVELYLQITNYGVQWLAWAVRSQIEKDDISLLR